MVRVKSRWLLVKVEYDNDVNSIHGSTDAAYCSIDRDVLSSALKKLVISHYGESAYSTAHSLHGE
jgi:hypothetical protein